MISLLRNGPAFIIPVLFIVVIVALTAGRSYLGELSSMVIGASQLHAGDIYSSKLAPVPDDPSQLHLTLMLTRSGVNAIKTLKESHAGDTSAALAYEGTSLGTFTFSKQADPAIVDLTLPTKAAFAARMAIGR